MAYSTSTNRYGQRDTSTTGMGYNRSDTHDQRHTDYRSDPLDENHRAVDQFVDRRASNRSANRSGPRNVWDEPTRHNIDIRADESRDKSPSPAPLLNARLESVKHVIELLQTAREKLPAAIEELQQYTDDETTHTKRDPSEAILIAQLEEENKRLKLRLNDRSHGTDPLVDTDMTVVSKLEHENKSLNRKLQRQDAENKKVTAELNETKEQLQVIETQCNSITGKSTYKSEMAHSATAYSKLESELSRKRDEFEKLQNQAKEDRDLFKKSFKDVKQKYAELLKDNDNLQTYLKDLVDEKKELQKLKTEAGSTFDELRRYKSDEHTLRKEVETLRVNERDLKRQLNDAGRELEETKTRLSKIMSDQLMTRNPNITDLSDSNRPEKIGERYQECYDNQWTDAYEVVEKSYPADDGKAVRILLEILTEAKKFCDREADRQMKDLEKALLQSSGMALTELPAQLNRQLKDTCKANATSSAKEIYKKYLRELENSFSSKARVALTVKDFVQECVTVCWLMALQDPPVVFGPRPGHMEHFDTSVYKAYTQSGSKIDYVVWPPLYLHEGGPLVAKGIAQAYKSPSDKRVPTSKKRDAARSAGDITHTSYTSSLLSDMKPHTGTTATSSSYPTDHFSTNPTTVPSENPSTTYSYLPSQYSDYPSMTSSSQAQSRGTLGITPSSQSDRFSTAYSATPLGQTAREKFHDLYGYYPVSGQSDA